VRQPGGLQMTYMFIRFDQNYIRRIVLPQLVAEFTTAEERAEFEFEIGPRDPGNSQSRPVSTGQRKSGTEGVIAVDLLRYRPDCLPPRPFVAASTPGPLSGLVFSSEGPPHHVPLPGVPHHILTPGAPDRSRSVEEWIKAAGHCPTRTSGSGDGLLQLVVRQL